MTSKQGKRLNPFQHALTRPDTYIGSIKTVMRDMWIFQEPEKDQVDDVVDTDIEAEENENVGPKGMFVLKKIKYNQGLTRIFVEIMSNAIDNKWRSEQHGTSMKKIDFTIDNDPESEKYGWITVMNDGYCIPVEKAIYEYEDYRNKKTIKEELYPAEVFFGEMLAGTNFEEDDTRKTSGRNGLGSKATIIFSSEAIVDHSNPEHQKRFLQIYRKNGTERDPPKITSYKAKTGYTSLAFLPDYERFGYPGMDAELFALFKRYIYEAAMITGLPVTLNGEKIVVKDLNKFARLFYPDPKENCMISFNAPNGDECVLMEKGIPDTDVAEEISHISWVNGINTRDGGVHVDAWKDAIFDRLVRVFNTRKPKKGEKDVLKASAKELYPYFVMFVRAEAAGAQFDSQTKDRMTQPEVDLAPEKKEKAEFNKSLLEVITKKVMKWNFISLLEEKLTARADRAQSKKDGVKKKIAFGKNVLEANLAGTKQAGQCSIFITEGMSAKLFADRMISSIENGTDYYGSFAIRGKFINAQKSSIREVNANEEVKGLKQVLGLITGQVYEDTSDLRYGHVIFMTDQDDDGFHIRGLLINFFWHFWPSLFDLVCEDGEPYFMFESFTTAVVIGMWGKNIRLFYSNPEFRGWYDKEGYKIKGLKIKYYKGLGSHVPGDERLYLNDQKKLQYGLDGEDQEYMTLGFADKQSDWRKAWITRDMIKPGEMRITEDEIVPITIDGPISLSTFVDQQLSIYHKMSLSRALPNMYDGFKHSQRQVFYGIMVEPKARKGSMNIENLVGSVKLSTGYHHGGHSLEDTIKGMAQGFVGSNNIPLLVNDGEFGSRMEGGKDAAAARYIATRLEEVADALFSKLDLPILEKVVEDGEEREYKMFMPTVPTLLINGGKGIASGYSFECPSYDPVKLVEWEEEWLNSEDGAVDLPPLVPYYRGFTGTIELMEKEGKKYKVWDPDTSTGRPTAWRSKGILEQGKGGWWHIKELPIGLWTNKMKEYLEYLETGTPPEGSKKKKGDRYLTTVRWKGTPNTIHWEIKPSKDFIPDMDVSGNFKCMQSMGYLTNIHVLDENGYPRKYASPEALLYDFCPKRLEYYELRKEYWIGEYTKDLERETDRYKYVKAVVDKKLNMYQEDDKLEADMLKMGLRKVVSKKDERTEGETDDKSSFSYLLSMQMRSMTVKKLAEIKKDVEAAKTKIDALTSKTAKDLWREDLATFKASYAKFLKTRKDDSDSKTKIKMK